MEFDAITIIACILALIVGLAITYFYNKYKCDAVDEVYDILKTIWEKYGVKLEQDNPELYKELESAITELDKAMDDKDISIMEAFMIAKAFIPLTKRLTEYVAKQYS